jgi:hypothetical protein
MHMQAAINALNRGMPLATELACADSQRRAWIGVYPLDLSDAGTRQFLRNVGVEIFPEAGRAYHIRTFEVDRTLTDRNVWIGETELLNKRSAVAFSEESLIEQLKTFAGSLESLEPHHKSDYPI